MATNGLGCLMMTAVIDQGFRQRLLAAPTDIVDDFNLTDEEQRALASIQARSFPDFADQLCEWLEGRDPLSLGAQRDANARGLEEKSSWGFPVEAPAKGAVPRVARNAQVDPPREGASYPAHPRHAQGDQPSEEQVGVALPIDSSELQSSQ
ncbi:MAG: hypothetical protein MAG451_00008 [Anaerolineales bacterium]|nr:hypothetical protein [Anaerolineales bacterium]